MVLETVGGGMTLKSTTILELTEKSYEDGRLVESLYQDHSDIENAMNEDEDENTNEDSDDNSVECESTIEISSESEAEPETNNEVNSILQQDDENMEYDYDPEDDMDDPEDQNFTPEHYNEMNDHRDVFNI
ncbi:pheromone-processing carboxypeptidase KEX1-like [Spinacia oleracea]|uniref:Pheromone-processing carboxypeptidase KEX1-like n=1 Tax=Spinacia oleracea TaxID=3562 RepID=A0ABM3R3L7_SPIOL|nr:pheromone-processing carboxypeptidase KEX1-like [Spinacia oleracea]